MRSKEYLKERKRRNRGKAANKEAIKIAQLNTYKPGDPDWESKQTIVLSLVGATDVTSLSKGLEDLAVCLIPNPRFSRNQIEGFYAALSNPPVEGGIIGIEGFSRKALKSDEFGHQISINASLQLDTLINTYKIRDTDSSLRKLELLSSIFNNAHMAADKIPVTQIEYDHRTVSARFTRAFIQRAMDDKAIIIPQLIEQKALTVPQAEALFNAQSPTQLEACAGSDYLLVYPFKQPIEDAKNLVFAFREVQNLLYLGFSIGMRDLSKAYWGKYGYYQQVKALPKVGFHNR